jgi:hypothetical protein
MRRELSGRRLARGEPGTVLVEVREVTSRPKDSKVARAQPVVVAAKQAQLRMVAGLGVLEAGLSRLRDDTDDNDGPDALVHACRSLAGWAERKPGEAPADHAAAFEGLEVAQRVMPAPGWGRTREAPGDDIDEALDASGVAEGWDRA